jgi:hypothetical protein
MNQKLFYTVMCGLVVMLTACGGGGSTGVTDGNTKSDGSGPTPVSQLLIKVMDYQNEYGVSQVFNTSVADLNGDGLEDIVVSGWAVMPTGWTGVRNSNVPIKILIQQEDGTLLDRTQDLLGSNNMIAGVQRILVEDFDNDGKLDIFVGGFQDVPSRWATSVIFWNNGLTWARQDFTESVWAHAACAGDLRGTGRKDIVMGADQTNPNTILVNNGARSLTVNRILTNIHISTNGSCSIIKDPVTGNIGIITTNVVGEGSHSAYVRVFDSRMNYITTYSLPGSEEMDNLNLTRDLVNIVNIDIDKDGDLDVIITDNGNFRSKVATGKFIVLINSGNFNFVNQTSTYFPSQTNNYVFGYYTRLIEIGSKISLFVSNAAKSPTAALWKQDGVLFSNMPSELTLSYSTVYKTRNNSINLLLFEKVSHGKFTFYTKSM